MYPLITRGSFMFRLTAVALAVAVTLFGFAFSTARADVNPANCLANDFTTQVNKSVSVAYDETNPHGATSIVYSVAAGNPQNSNTPPDGCNVDAVNITLTTPDGVVHTIQTGGNYPVGTPVATVGSTVTYVARSVDIVSGQLTASVSATGSLHDIPNGTDPLNSTKTVGVTVIHPNTTVTITPSVATTSVGSSVNLTVTEHNTGDNPLSSPSVTLTPPGATLNKASATFSGGDTNGDGILDTTETWVWVVPTIVNANTTYTAVGNGTDSLGNPVTPPNYPSEQASTTVHVLNAPTIATTLSATSVSVGTAVHDSSVLTGASAGAGGTVSYTVYTNNTCTAGAQSAGTKTVTAGVVPDSNPLTFNNAGSYYWQAAYSGDANNSPATSTCQEELLTVGKSAPTITTELSDNTVTVGGAVHDSATLSGETATAGGTATYTVYTDNQCTQGAVDGGTKTVTNGVIPDSNIVTFNTPGTYYWQVSYSGDANNAAATSTCGSEVVTVGKFTPSISTTLSATSVSTSTPVHDSATLSGASANAGGQATYTVFTDSSCTAGAQSAGTKTVTSGIIPDSDSLTFANPGTYYWQVTYSGDANNAPATSTCTREVLTVTVPPPPPSTSCEVDWKPVGIGYMDFGPIVNLNKNGRLLSANNPCPLTLPPRFSPGSTTPTTTVPLQTIPITMPRLTLPVLPTLPTFRSR